VFKEEQMEDKLNIRDPKFAYRFAVMRGKGIWPKLVDEPFKEVKRKRKYKTCARCHKRRKVKGSSYCGTCLHIINS
jgi:hypothetical protein